MPRRLMPTVLHRPRRARSFIESREESRARVRLQHRGGERRGVELNELSRRRYLSRTAKALVI